MDAFTGFPDEALVFLEELPGHDKAWFAEHRKTYEAEIAKPAKAFVAAMTGPLQARISPDLVGIPRVNGSIAPINRDIRFSADKTTYKGELLFKWWEGPDKRTAPTLYVRIGDEHVGFGVGAALPSLDRWRELVDAERTGAPLAQALAVLVEQHGATVVGAEYKRVPKPYPADHPRADLLRHKWLQVRWGVPFPDEISGPDFPAWCVDRLAAAADVHHWLVRHL